MHLWHGDERNQAAWQLWQVPPVSLLVSIEANKTRHEQTTEMATKAPLAKMIVDRNSAGSGVTS